MRWIAPTIVLIALPALNIDAAPEMLICGWFSNNVIECRSDGSSCSTLVTSGAGGLSNAHSIEVGPDLDLYVTSFNNGRVVRYDGATGALIDIFVPSGSGGLAGVTDCVFGPDGNLYCTSFGTDCVLRYNGATGAFIDQFVTSGSGGLLNPESLTFGPDGNLYVLSGNNRNVVRYDGATGAFMNIFIPTGSGGITDPHYLFFHDDGLLYVTAFGNHKVVRYDAGTGAFVDVFVQDDPSTPEIDESGGLSSAHGSAFGPDGHLYVTSFSNDRVLRYDGTTGAFMNIAVAPQGGANGPIDIVFADVCPGDIDNSGDVGFTDLLSLISSWGPCPGATCDADITGDGTVNFEDLLTLLAAWGPCP